MLRELGARGIEVIAIGRGPYSLGQHSRHCHTFVERPEGPVAGWLADLVAANDAQSVMAVSESDLVQLAELKGAIPGVTVAVPDPEPLALVLDKARTLGVAHEIGIDVPASWQPQAGDDFAACAATLAYPVVLKWSDPPAMAGRLAAAGIALEKAEHAADAAALLAILARYDALGAWPLVQTWCAGYGLGQMFNMAGGRATLRFQHRRLREWPVSGGVSSFCAAVPLTAHAVQLAKSEELLAAIGWQGPAMVEYRHDPASGKYWLMEINGRFWGSIPLAHHCGAHFGWEAWRTQVRGERSPSVAAVRMGRARYLVPDLKHLAAVLRDPATGVAGKVRLLAGFVARFLDPRTGYYVWSWRDPGPFFADLRAILAKLRHRGSAPPAP